LAIDGLLIDDWAPPAAPPFLLLERTYDQERAALVGHGFIMNDSEIPRQPGALAGIRSETDALGFNMSSEPRVGSLLAVLAASKPAGRLLELGTGTGHGTAWLLAGMDGASTLDTVDTDANVVAVAQRHLGSDSRVSFHVLDGAQFLERSLSHQFDLIYADAWAGKFSHLDQALSLLRPGGIYVIDDLLPQPNWPAGHAAKVSVLIDDVDRRGEFATVRLAWASGLMLVVRRAGDHVPLADRAG
jgi:predicted O-methyltransferase YrrM